MYTQSGLRMLCKVASLIEDGYLDDNYYDSMAKEADMKKKKQKPGRITKKRKKQTRETIKQAPGRYEKKYTLPIDQALATQAADSGTKMSLIPSTRQPGRVLVYREGYPGASGAAANINKTTAKMTLDNFINYVNNFNKANANAQRRLNAVDVPGGLSRLELAKQTGMYGGRPIIDMTTGESLAKIKGGKVLMDEAGQFIPRRDYMSPKLIGDVLAKLNRQKRQTGGSIVPYVFEPEVIPNSVAEAAAAGNGGGGFKPNPHTIDVTPERLALPGGKSGWLRRLLKSRRGKLIAAAAGGLALAGGGGAGAVAYNNKKKQEAAAAAEAEAKRQEAIAQAAAQKAYDDKRSLYGNIGMAGGATAGGLAGYGVGSALGGGATTKLILSALGAFGGGYGGKKLGEYLA